MDASWGVVLSSYSVALRKSLGDLKLSMLMRLMVVLISTLLHSIFNFDMRISDCRLHGLFIAMVKVDGKYVIYRGMSPSNMYTVIHLLV